MDALKFWNELQRICGIFKSCDDCPLYEEVCMGCSLYDIEDIKRTIQIVEQWSKEHPQKTRLDDFKEKYPNASPDAHGFPDFCCAKLGYVCNCGETTCEECWNMPLEEE